MPVTAKLSRKFYETFGDELTNELVNWLNQVDTSYRTEFRELFEVHFGRFDAKLDQRVGELRAEMREAIAGVRAELGEKFTRELVAARVEWRDGLAAQRGDLTAGLAGVRTEMATFRAEMLRWVLLLWIGMLGTLVALLKL
jgi:hypothetical protein